MIQISSQYKNFAFLSQFNNRYFVHFASFDFEKAEYSRVEVNIQSLPKAMYWCGEKMIVK
jgi:hypothetical protein